MVRRENEKKGGVAVPTADLNRFALVPTDQRRTPGSYFKIEVAGTGDRKGRLLGKK